MCVVLKLHPLFSVTTCKRIQQPCTVKTTREMSDIQFVPEEKGDDNIKTRLLQYTARRPRANDRIVNMDPPRINDRSDYKHFHYERGEYTYSITLLQFRRYRTISSSIII